MTKRTPDEQVKIATISHLERLIAYAIPALSGSGAVELNGAAARWGMKNERVTIVTYGQLNSGEIASRTPTGATLGSGNQIVEIIRYGKD